MKIINAFWEQRNLKMNSYEVELEHDDDLNQIELEIKKLVGAQYIVFKVPIGCLDMYALLVKYGCFYVETLCNIGISLMDYTIPTKIAKIDSKIKYCQVDDKLLDVVCNRIEENIFTTDRIALDKVFGLSLANRRYSNWLRDEFLSGRSKIYEIKLGNNGIGFFGLKDVKSQTVELFLAGMYNEAKEFGLGFSMISKSIEVAISLGYRYLETNVSTNNIEVLRLYMSLGFNFVGIKYIFVKHL